MNLSFTLLGFVVAALVAMTGVGGGSLMAPILILGMHVAPGVAVGTDLLYTAVTRAGALWVYARKGQVKWRLAARMLAGSLPAAAVAMGAIVAAGTRSARLRCGFKPRAEHRANRQCRGDFIPRATGPPGSARRVRILRRILRRTVAALFAHRRRDCDRSVGKPLVGGRGSARRHGPAAAFSIDQSA